MDDDLTALLGQYDEPEHLEVPSGYHHARTRALFERLVAGLESSFGSRCEVDRQVQDAAFHGRLDVPGEATVAGERIVVKVSNFGSMAVIAAENPGIHLDTGEAVEAGALDPADLARVEEVLAELGYVVLPERLLWRRYDGVVPGLETWWNRYFDYL
ncbi:hypothetical protein ACIA8O_31225 [Kitasatospora sp. NPDC051853]|uniref:hypothetical protein n=1 Tax=Kitasatospora sp. NPDC051853 TaxID=3364058 RepID=UPI0037B35012